MGRIASGWKLRQRKPGHAFAVRFWLNGRELERSTGTSDPDEAAREAARIYAAEVQREPPKRQPRISGGHDLEELVAAWLVHLSATHDPGTCETWGLYGMTHFVPHFEAVHNFTSAMAAEYMRARLGKVQASTVRKELSALRQFCEWMHGAGFIGHKVEVPGVPKRTIGTVYEKRRRAKAIEISPEECRAVIEALPEWSNSKKLKEQFPIRARFVVAYETGLRPALLDGLIAGVHYRPGSSSLSITPELDKARWGREVPLSQTARAALDAVCPAEGPIFGRHRYDEHIEAAASKALPPDRARLFAGAHFRSAMTTHRLEQTGNLPGVQYLVGHKLATTTAGYVRASLRAALDVVKLAEQKTSHGKKKPRAKAT